MPWNSGSLLPNGGAALADLYTIAEEIRELIVTRGRRSAVASAIVKIVLIPTFACLAGVSQFADFKGGNASTVQVVGIVGTVLVGVLSLIIGIFEKDSANEMAKASEALDAARELQRDLESVSFVFREIDRTVQYISAASLARAVIERLLVSPTGSLEAWVTAMLAASERNMRVAMGFQMSHRWTLTVYRAEAAAAGVGHLRPIATSRALPCALADARIWDMGTGVVGAAFTNRSEVVLPDLSKPGLKELFGTKANRTKPDDLDVYRSMAAMPVHLDGHDTPWGVVVATSDQTNHFNVEDDATMRPDMVVKEVAGLVALLVAAYARVEVLAGQQIASTLPVSGTPSDNHSFTTRLKSVFMSGRATL